MDAAPDLHPTTPGNPSLKGARRRRWLNLAALAIALAADAIQIGLLPLFMGGAAAPWNDALDIGVGAAMVALLGWHVMFLPAFLGELVPLLNLFPTWTATVVFVLTSRKGAP
jgi:putative Mn2+ efflux pump MntP